MDQLVQILEGLDNVGHCGCEAKTFQGLGALGQEPLHPGVKVVGIVAALYFGTKLVTALVDEQPVRFRARRSYMRAPRR